MNSNPGYFRTLVDQQREEDISRCQLTQPGLYAYVWVGLTARGGAQIG